MRYGKMAGMMYAKSFPLVIDRDRLMAKSTVSTLIFFDLLSVHRYDSPSVSNRQKNTPKQNEFIFVPA